MTWASVTLAEVLQITANSVSIRDDLRYKQVMILPYPRGITLKAVKSGLDFSKKRQKLVHAGQFVISRFRVRRGIWGLVSPDLEGGVLSTHHLTFDLHPDLNPDYFAAYLVSPLFKQAAIAACSPHNRLLLPDFERIALPLPPAEIQAAIAEVWRGVNAALAHTADMVAAIADVKIGVARDLFGGVNPSWEQKQLGQAAQIGRGVFGDHMLTLIAPDQIFLGAQPAAENSLGILPGIELDSHYLYYVLESQQQALRERLVSAAPQLESALQTLPLALPTLYEQRKMAAVLQQHDESLLRIRAEQVALRRLTQGIMQLIFSGTLDLQPVLPLLRQFMSAPVD
ncbi:MAG: hypothetical protein GC204_04490 [Chloroflexi bacterium]|nr:hypothetical protein [Chloroflexota bacterium]